MSNSLQDQLLKKGLVDKNKAKKVAKDKRKQTNQARKGGAVDSAADERKRLAREARKKQAERDRLLNKERQEAAEKRALQAQIKQLIEMNQQSLDGGEEPYSFTDGTKVKRLFLTPHIHQQVAAGRLAIVRSGESYAVVPAGVAEKIALRDRETVVLLNDKASEDEIEDEYAEYKIPDDLMW